MGNDMNKEVVSDQEFCLSLSQTSWISYRDVIWLLGQCDGNRELTKQLFSFWSKSGFMSNEIFKYIRNSKPC